MENKIKEFVKKSFDSGYGSSYGYGYGSSYGYGSGSGAGSDYGSGAGSGYGVGYGSGDGSGYGSGYGDGDGDGYGDGDGDGSGYSDGYGYGTGSGYGVIKYKNHGVHNIDGIATIITYVRGNYAKGFILNDDFTLSKTYIVKEENTFSHGETLREALDYLAEKLSKEAPLEERLSKFKSTFNKIDKYSGEDFFRWHSIITRSCLAGRKSFVKNNELDLKALYTVEEFLKIVENHYGWENLEELVNHYKKEKK